MDYRKLENDMYDIANKLVGNVGPKVEACVESSGVVNYTPHPLSNFSLIRVSIDYPEIIDIWTKWIESYIYFRKYHCPEAAEVFNDPDLIVRWLKKPTVRDLPENLFHVSAYLVICRTDSQSWRIPHDTTKKE